MSDCVSIAILIGAGLLIILLIYNQLWELRVKEDLKFLTEEEFRKKHPYVYMAMKNKKKK